MLQICTPRLKHIQALCVVLLCLACAGLGGCMDLTGRGKAPLGRTVETDRDHPLAGHVYCMRGFLGIFSTGMDELADKIDKEVAAVSVANEEMYDLRRFLVAEHQAGRLNEPIVLVGHSYGADDQIRTAEELGRHGIKVDLLITIDPVTPPPVPENVVRAMNIHKSRPVTDGLPFWRGVEVPPGKVPVMQIDLRTAKVPFETESIDHINIEKSEGVHAMVMNEIRKVCPPRAMWHGRTDRHLASPAPAGSLDVPGGIPAKGSQRPAAAAGSGDTNRTP